VWLTLAGTLDAVIDADRLAVFEVLLRRLSFSWIGEVLKMRHVRVGLLLCIVPDEVVCASFVADDEFVKAYPN
jgi:hypothetical protein